MKYLIHQYKELLDPALYQHTGIATKVLVFLLAGIARRWKFAYYFTGKTDAKTTDAIPNAKNEINVTGNAF